MEWFFAIIIVLGIFTLFGWNGIHAIGRLLGLIGAAIIIFIGGSFLLAFLDLDITNKEDLVFIGILIALGFLGSMLMKEPTEEEKKKTEEVYARIREELKRKEQKSSQ